MFFRGGVPHAKQMLGKQLRIGLQIGDKISAFFNICSVRVRKTESQF